MQKLTNGILGRIERAGHNRVMNFFQQPFIRGYGRLTWLLTTKAKAQVMSTDYLTELELFNDHRGLGDACDRFCHAIDGFKEVATLCLFETFAPVQLPRACLDYFAQQQEIPLASMNQAGKRLSIPCLFRAPRRGSAEYSGPLRAVAITFVEIWLCQHKSCCSLATLRSTPKNC